MSDSNDTADVDLPPSPVSSGRRATTPSRPSGVPRISSRAVEGGTLACRRCHHRKKKCDRAKPYCSSCVKSRVECVYDLIISDKSHPNFITDLLTETTAQRERIAYLERRLASLESSKAASASVSVSDPAKPVLRDSIDPLALLFQSDPVTNTTSFVPTLDFSLPNIGSSSNSNSSSGPTFAERIVRQVLTAELDRRETGYLLRGTIGQQLGTSQEQDDDGDSGDGSAPPGTCAPGQTQPASWSPKTTLTSWPPPTLARKLVDQFFCFTAGFYPVVERSDVENDLKDIYAATAPEAPNMSTYPNPDLRVYRLFMIFAIGCNLLEQRNSRLRMDSTPLRTYAFQHFTSVLRGDDITCLTGILLWAICSILDFSRLSPYAVLGIASRFAIEMGFHQERPDLPVEKQEARKRLFWSLFCMDRLVASTFTKAVCLPDQLITVRLPDHLSGSVMVQMEYMSATTFFHNMVLVRRMNGIVLHEIYLGAPGRNGDEVLARVRNQLDDWFHSVPRPPPPGPAHHLFFELYYNICLTTLYRPSPLFAHTHPMRMPALRKASGRAIELYRQLHAERKMAQNYVHLYHIVSLAVALIYTLIESEGDPQNLQLSSWRREAVREVDVCGNLLATFCVAWPGVSKFRDAFATLAADVKARIAVPDQPAPAAPQQLQTWCAPAQLLSNTTTTGPDISLAQQILHPSPTTSQDAADQALWDSWTTPNPFATTTEYQTLDVNVAGVGMDALFASVGLSGFDTTVDWQL